MPYKDKQQQKEAKARIARARYESRLKEHREDKTCLDCGHDEWRILVFHHRDPSTKVDTVASLMSSAGGPRLLAEIAKCDLICPNCHALRHLDLAEASESESRGGL